METIEPLPDVYIQDPFHATGYYIPARALRLLAGEGTRNIDRSQAVTFTLPGATLIDEFVDTSPPWSSTPDVLIRDMSSGEEFHLPFHQLQSFQVGQLEAHPEAKTYTLPMPEALVAEMPAVVRALLQTDFTRTSADGRTETIPS